VSASHPNVVKLLTTIANKARAELGDFTGPGSGARFFDEVPKWPARLADGAAQTKGRKRQRRESKPKFDEEGGQFRGSRALSLKSGPPYSDDERRAKTAAKLADPALTAPGERIVYSGDKLTGIRFPVGGVGSGCIQVDGFGVLRDWQVFNNKGNKAKTRGGFDILRHIDSGNHIDQCLGDWWAAQVGVGPIYNPAKVTTAMKNLFRDNFIPDATGFIQAYRKYWEDGDAGLLITTWDKDKLPATPMKYNDEVMSGFEYAAAALMIRSGNLKEGFAVAKAVRDRYDGRARATVDASAGYESGSPFGDDECGKYYGRAMASWSLLTALQGFRFDGPRGIIGFDPVWQPYDHRSFFTVTAGYGIFTQKRDGGAAQANTIKLLAGSLLLREVFLGVPNKLAGIVAVTLDGQPLPAITTVQDGQAFVRLKSPITLKEEQTLGVLTK
jgi:hypothetical protein